MRKAPEICPIEERLKPFYEALCVEIACLASFIQEDEIQAETIRMTARRVRKQLDMLSVMPKEERRKYLAGAIRRNRLQVLRNQGTQRRHIIYVETKTLDLLAPAVPDHSGKVEAEDVLEKALPTLTELERKVLTLALDEGWTRTAIAASLGTSVANVTQTLGRARRKFENFLK